MLLITSQEFSQVERIGFRKRMTDVQSQSPSPPRWECWRSLDPGSSKQSKRIGPGGKTVKAVQNISADEQALRGSKKYQRRWLTLLVLSMVLLIIGLDVTVLNVALPTLQQELGASASELQWVVNAYVLVFAGVLLTMGTLGDRFGRKLALQVGLVVFGAASVAAGYADSTTQLIIARVGQGIGGAMIMPSTLSVIVDIFPRSERPKAIGIWAGVSALGIPLGMVGGGWLLENFS
jgi:sugar phosphate permease